MSQVGDEEPPRIAGPFSWRRHPWGWLLECAPIARIAVHGFTTRQLAMAGAAGCEAEWRLLAESAGVALDAIAAVNQGHGTTVVHARALNGGDRARADGLLSNDASLLLTVRVADCVPILMVDPKRRAVAAVHAGWRGTAAGIAGAAVQQLRESYGCSPRDLVAALGPSIGPCCYAVGPELLQAFDAGGHGSAAAARWFGARTDTMRLDLWKANEEQLVAAGVSKDAVFVSGLCTACHPSWFFSYRREGASAGRLVGFIRAPRPDVIGTG